MRFVKVGNDIGINPKSGHQQEMLGALAIDRDVPDIDASTLGADHLLGGAGQIHRDTDLVRPQIRGAARNHADGDIGPDQAIDHLTDRSVTAGGNDDIAPVISRFSRQLGRVTTVHFLMDRNIPTVSSKDRQYWFEINFAAATTRIRNQAGSDGVLYRHGKVPSSHRTS
jgi:hypothetical protein